MDKLVSDFMSNIPSLTAEEIAAISAHLDVRTYAKGAVLLKEGEINRECYFVLEGCIRQYYLKDGMEKTTAFFTEKQTAVSGTSYLEQSPSKHYLCCMEPCTLIVGDFHKEQAMLQKFPKLEAITRQMMQQDLGKLQSELDFFITSTPEERYLNLLSSRAELLQRVPQYHIASYLGMTAESLSRIRKRVAENG